MRASYDIVEQQSPTAQAKRCKGEFVSLLSAQLTTEEEHGFISFSETETDGGCGARLLSGERIAEPLLRAAGKTARKARTLEFGADGGFMMAMGWADTPAHMPNIFSKDLLPLPLRAIYAIGATLATPGGVLLGEGVAAFECSWDLAGDGAALGVRRKNAAACGFEFELGASGKFVRGPISPDSALRACTGEYETTITDRTEGPGVLLFGQRVKFEATRHRLVSEDESVQLR